MPPFQNLGFEEVHPAVEGFAADWHENGYVDIVATAEQPASFAWAQTWPPTWDELHEGFEGGWSSNQSYTFAYADPIDLGEILPAVFDGALPNPEGVEDFDQGWSSNQNYSFTMVSAPSATWDSNAYITATTGPYVMDVGDSLEIETDLGTEVSTAVAALGAVFVAASPPTGLPYAARTVRFNFNERASVEVTFYGEEMTVADLCDVINARLVAEGMDNEGSAFPAGSNLALTTGPAGYATRITVENTEGLDDIAGDLGFHPDQIGLDAGEVGSGNVAITDAVPVSDLVALINGDADMSLIGVRASEVGGALRIHSAPGLRIEVNDFAGNAAATSLASWTSYTGETYTLGTEAGPSDLPSADFEGFEDGWANGLWVSYFFSWYELLLGPGDDSASFDSTPTAVEDFENEWRTNESYAFDMGSTSVAVFEAENYEDFEEVNLVKVFTANPATDVLTSVAHGMANGQIVTFENTGGQLPGGIQPDTNYYVVGVATDTFQIATVSGGSAVDISGTGTGTHRVRPDTDVYWTTRMVTI